MSETPQPARDLTWVFGCGCGHVSRHSERSAVVGIAQAHALNRHGSLLPEAVVIPGLHEEEINKLPRADVRSEARPAPNREGSHAP